MRLKVGLASNYNEMTQMIQKLFLFLVTSLSLSACYRMPTEDDYCLVPNVNNPSITREKSGSAMPNLKY